MEEYKISILDLTCKASVSFSKNCCTNNKLLLLGGRNNYISCLYFDFPLYLCIKHLISAKLILFKYPTIKYFCQEERGYSEEFGYHGYYSVSPLLEFFSMQSCQYPLPKTDFDKNIKFINTVYLCYTEIDITDIVTEWLDDTLENKGLMLTGGKNIGLISFASEKDDNPGMRPMIRLIFKENPCWEGFSSTPCVVKVK